MLNFIMRLFTYCLILYFGLQANVPLAHSRNRSRSLLWQAGTDLSSINNMRCLARSYDISYVQTFRFLELTRNLINTNKNMLSIKKACATDISIILYIGPTREQLRIANEPIQWLMHNYKIYQKHAFLYDLYFGSDNIILQLYDEPSNTNDVSLINSFCNSYPHHKYFLSTNSRSLHFIDKLILNCFTLIDFHSYGTSQRSPQLFAKQVISFLSKLQSTYRNYYSITLPLFRKMDSRSNKMTKRVFNYDSYFNLVSNLYIKPSFYGAYLSPNVGFMQDDLFYLYFQNYNLMR